MARSRHNPTSDEITAACAKIRCGWSELEYRRRSGWDKEIDSSLRWRPPEYNAREIGLLDGRTIFDG